MGKYKLRKTKTNPSQTTKKSEEMATGDSSGAVSLEEANEHTDINVLQASVNAIHAEIKAGHMDMKKELHDIGEKIRHDMKEELKNFKDEVNKKLSSIGTELEKTEARMEEVETRVAEVEDWNACARDVLLQTVQEQQDIQSKLLDLETRSRRNNLRVFGIPEGTEGSNAREFLEKVLQTELSLTDTDFGIQRCHRSLGPKPPAHAPPRSIIACFLTYRTKELVLSAAWGKKEIHLNGHRIFFDHDYPAEIMKRRKEYAPLRKILKEKGLRFQTPAPAKLRVFYGDGPKTYNNAKEAREDMAKKGILTAGEYPNNAVPAGNRTDPGETTVISRRKSDEFSWQVRGPTRHPKRGADAEWARERLRKFQRSPTHKES